MADDIDNANELVELSLERAIRKSKESKPVATATGSCLWCEEPVEPPRRWCNRECCELWEKNQ